MKISKKRKAKKIISEELPVEEESLSDNLEETRSIEDFIERKRLQNEVLRKLINQIKEPDKSENNKNK